MRSLGAITLVLLAALAGCIGTEGLDEGEQLDIAGENDTVDSTDLEVQETLTMGGCTEQVGFFPLVAPSDTVPLPEGFESENLLYVVATECDMVDAAEEGKVSQIQAGLLVTPPDRFALDGSMGHGVPLGSLVDDANVTSVFQSWNMGQIEQAEVLVDRVAETPAGHTGHALGGTEDFTVHMYSQASIPGDGAAGVIRLFGVDDGVVTNAVDLAWTEAPLLQGEATLVIEGAPGLPPFPAPVEPGIVEHWWGEDYAFDYTYVPLDEMTSQ